MRRARRSRARPLARTEPPPPRVVFDSGGLSALIGPSQKARAWLRWILEHDGSIAVPTAVLVETTTGDGARDAEINRILGVLGTHGCVLAAPDESVARLAGRLRFRARIDDGIDALVAAAAVGDGTPCVLLTSDPGDMSRLLEGTPAVSVEAV